jgi:polyhydroxyalkanoate synthase subunit PhaC
MSEPNPSAQASKSADLGGFLSQAFENALSQFKGFSSPLGTVAPLVFEPAMLEQIRQEFVSQASELWNQSLHANLKLKDRRFNAEAWSAQPASQWGAAMYLLSSRTLVQLAQALQIDQKTKTRIQFAVEQFVAASAPSNFLATNVEALDLAVKTQGASLSQGLENLVHDLRQGHVSMTDERLFEVGKNVATTPGEIIFENDFFQLIEYTPLTPKVFEKPLLLVPPCINKYYILDLQPENSLIRYALSQGHRTLVVSWNNPKESMSEATWEDYIQHAVLKAIEVATHLSAVGKINALGFCVGGTMLTCALAVLSARGEHNVSSATLLTTLVDFSNTGILDVFIDEAMVQLRELQFAKGGLLPGRELAQTFSFLRPNELVWNYVVGNYLKGQTPPAFDLLYWNSDATNLPGPLYAWYLRNTYLENRLIQPGAVSLCGHPLDLGLIKQPLFIYGSQEDHIVPVDSAYASTQVFKGPKTFVMGASGHIAGVINPPQAKKRSHWISAKRTFPAKLQTWLETANEVPGSWWTHWAQWLSAHAGAQVAAPKRPGNGLYQPIESAPGRYVAVKV